MCVCIWTGDCQNDFESGIKESVLMCIELFIQPLCMSASHAQCPSLHLSVSSSLTLLFFVLGILSLEKHRKACALACVNIVSQPLVS